MTVQPTEPEHNTICNILTKPTWIPQTSDLLSKNKKLFDHAVLVHTIGGINISITKIQKQLLLEVTQAKRERNDMQANVNNIMAINNKTIRGVFTMVLIRLLP
ncbi:hypothetical protein YC2023_100831 [Brassica napus]